jgi:hypothetical protein
LLAVFLSLHLRAATYYVAKNGSDGNDGSYAHPWLTIGHAGTKVAAGDTVLVEQGTYSENLAFNGARGTAAAPVVFRSYNGLNTVIFGSIAMSEPHYVLRDFKIEYDSSLHTTQAVKIQDYGDSCEVRNCEILDPHPNSCDAQGVLIGHSNGGGAIHGGIIDSNVVHDFGNLASQDHGVYIQSRGTKITHNVIYNNCSRGIQLYAGGGEPDVDSNEIAYNVCHDNRNRSGMVLLGHYNWIHDNVCYGNATHGIEVYAGATNNLVTNNVCYANYYYGIFENGSGSDTVRNNICLDNGWGPMEMAYPPSAVDYNCYYPDDNPDHGPFVWYDSGNNWHGGNFAAWKAATGQDSNGICQNPDFRNAAGYNFHLQDTSPCIDEGDPTTPPGFDFDGIPTPLAGKDGDSAVVDMGAYEYHTFPYTDVKVEMVRPRDPEAPGQVPVQIKLTNAGEVPALVPRLDVKIAPAGYADSRENIGIAVGEYQIVMLDPWVTPAGGRETCTAWITYPGDMYPPDDTIIRPITIGILDPGWVEQTPLPAPPSGKTIKDGGCMAYDAGTDLIYASKGNKTGDFYSYSLRQGTWATRTGIPLGAEGKQVYKGSVLCSDGNGKLYLTKGNNTLGFWKYDAAQNAWTQMTNVPLGPARKKVKQGAALAWATTNGVGHVYLLKGYRNEFYKYDSASNTWTQLLNAPIGPSNHVKWDAGSWMLSNPEPGAHMLYTFKAKYHEFYAYDTDADTWLLTPKLTPMPVRGTSGSKKAKDGSCAAWYNGVIYALKGGNTTEFWRYFVNGDTWRAQLDIPLFGTAGWRKKVKAGGSMAAYPSTGVYAFKGNKSNEFWRFRPFWEAAATQPSRDGVMAEQALDLRPSTFDIRLSPNPLASGFAVLRYSLPKAGLATLAVLDVTGRTVLTQTLTAGRTGTASLNLRKLEAGVYWVRVVADGFSTTQKLVVER